jgi:hypothetical protein
LKRPGHSAKPATGAASADGAHMLGFGGHFLTKSRRYSVTFRVLRERRVIHARTQTAALDAQHTAETTAMETELAYAGAGWRTQGTPSSPTPPPPWPAPDNKPPTTPSQTRSTTSGRPPHRPQLSDPSGVNLAWHQTPEHRPPDSLEGPTTTIGHTAGKSPLQGDGMLRQHC